MENSNENQTNTVLEEQKTVETVENNNPNSEIQQPAVIEDDKSSSSQQSVQEISDKEEKIEEEQEVPEKEEMVEDSSPERDENLQNFFVDKPETGTNLIQDTKMDLAPVKGNSKVKRCPVCNTFVSINKPHSATECQSRLAKFKANKGKKGTKKCKNKKQVDRLLKKVKTLAKKYGTKAMQKKYNFPAPVRNFFESYA